MTRRVASIFASGRQKVAETLWADLIPWILVGITWLLFAVFSRHGFDFTDEGFYYVRTEHPADDLTSNSWFGRFAGLFFRIYDGELWAMRLTSVLLMSAAGFILYRGWNKVSPVLSSGWCAMLVLSAMAGLAQIAPALSYKTMTGLGCTLWLGLWLHIVSQQGSCSLVMKLSLLLAVGVTFFGKPPAAAGLALFSLPALVTPRLRGRVLTWVAAAATGGLTLSLAAGAAKKWAGLEMANLFAPQSLGGITGSFAANVMQYLNPRFFAHLTTHVGKSLLDFAALAASLTWLLGIALVLTALLVRRKHLSFAMAQGVVIASLAFSAVHVFTLSRFVRQDYGYWSGELVPGYFAGVLMWGWAALSLLRGRWVMPGAMLVIAAIVPLLGWLGAHNSLGFESLFQLAPWVALASHVIYRVLDALQETGPTVRVIPAIFGAALFSHLWLGGVEAPYRQGRSLYQQTKEVTFTGERLTHYLDGKTGSMVNQTRALLKEAGFQKGDPILAFYNLPGIVFAVGGRSPGLGWYRDPEGSFIHEGIGMDLQKRTEQALMLVPEEQLKSAFIIQTSSSQSFGPLLAKRGIAFPAGYRQLGTVPKPNHIGGGGELTLWAPLSRAKPSLKP